MALITTTHGDMDEALLRRVDGRGFQLLIS